MSSIEIALIPPGSMAERYCEGRSFQMALAGNLLDETQKDYTAFYAQAWKPWNATWLLDNGAWETSTVDPETLLRLVRKCGATEVMAPDVLYDPYSTLEKTQKFLSVFRQFDFGHAPRPRVAAVAHGSTLDEAIRFATEIVHRAPDIRTIAISRTLVYKTGNPTARLELALKIKHRYPDKFQIHLLGFNDDWPTEIQHCNSFPGLIRSLDTTAPFLYAYHGLPIQAASKGRAPRPDNYFSLTLPDFSQSLVDQNVTTLDTWARTPLYDGKML